MQLHRLHWVQSYGLRPVIVSSAPYASSETAVVVAFFNNLQCSALHFENRNAASVAYTKNQ